MGDLNLNVDLRAGRNDPPVEQLAVAADLHLGRRSADTFVLDPERYGLALAHDTEPRRRNQHHTAIPFIWIARDESVYRCRETERADVGWHVMDAAIGDEDGARDSIRRHVGKRRIERAEQAGARGDPAGPARPGCA